MGDPQARGVELMPQMPPTQLRPAIAAYIRDFVARRRRVRAVRALATAVLLAVLWVMSWGMIDRLIGLPAGLRVVLLGSFMWTIAAVLARPLGALLRERIDWRFAAEQMERRDPARFGEALATVVSRRLAGDSDSGDALLQTLEVQVEDKIRQSPDQRTLAPWRPALRAAFAAAVALALPAALLYWPWLGMRQLLHRQMLPWADVPAVSTTQLAVAPGSLRLIQGEPLTIHVRAAPLPSGATPILRTRSDQQHWLSIGMTPAPDGSFTHTFASMLRDMEYQVSAGDAASDTYTVEVLRRPIVREIRVRLIYPAYVDREPLTFVNTGGAIEAPVGTTAELTVTASEPLDSAILRSDGRELPMQPTADPRQRRGDLLIANDATLELELLSARGVGGAGAVEIGVRAIADRAPIARLMLPDHPLLLRPADHLSIPLQAADDYGLAGLEARVEVNGKRALTLPVLIGADARRVERSAEIDLAAANAALGDALSITIAATDRAGQTSTAEPALVLIAADAITPQQQERVDELAEAARLAGEVTQELEAAQQLLSQSGRAMSKLAGASDAADGLVQALVRSSAGLPRDSIAPALAALADAAQQQAGNLQRLGADNVADPAQRLEPLLSRAQRISESLQPVVQAVHHGLAADLLLIQRRSLRAIDNPNANPAAARLGDYLASAMRVVGIAPTDPAADEKLRMRSAAAYDILRSTQGVDLAELARQWATAPMPQTVFLPQRLAIAAQLELLGADADPPRAADLQLASRAAWRIEQNRTSAAAARPPEDQRPAFASALASLLRGGNDPTAAADAVAARLALRAWSGEAPAATTQRAAPARRGNVARVRGTSATAPTSAARAAADVPLNQALRVIRRTQEELTEMPQQLGRLEQVAVWATQTSELAEQAQRDADSAAGEPQRIARRALQAAVVQADEAFDGLAQMGSTINRQRLVDALRELHATAPETAPLLAQLETDLIPTLEQLQLSIDDRDAAGVITMIGDARLAIAASQESLRRARMLLVQRDPLVAARWFAERAAATRPATAEAPAPDDPLAALRRNWTEGWQAQADLPAPAALQPATQPALLRPHLPSWRDQDLAPAMRRADPPEYQQALQTYFRMLGVEDAEDQP
jgi:hypothetical protein